MTLQGTALFPQALMPLHIFEPRYRQLIAECRDAGIHFGIPTAVPGGLSAFGTEVELVKILKSHAGSSALISLTVNGAKTKATRTALLRDYQVDPITGSVLHADLFEISMDKPIRVKVPVHVTGSIPAGVKEGGVLHHNMRELHIECLPAVLPDQIDVDASALGIGQGIHLKEVAKREGVRFLDDPDLMLVSVAAPRARPRREAPASTNRAAVARAEDSNVGQQFSRGSVRMKHGQARANWRPSPRGFRSAGLRPGWY